MAVAMVIMIVAVIGTKGKVPDKTILEANFENAMPRGCSGESDRKLMNGERPTFATCRCH